ncbi:MAG: HEAT repeat domain-containing protein [Archaeoglobaceae archaeon]
MHSSLERYINSRKYKKEFEELAISKDFVPELIQLSENEDGQVRIRAVYALGRIVENTENGLQEKEDVTNTFLKALHDQNKWVRGHAAHFLGRIYYPEEKIIDLMEDGCPWVRHRAAEAAGLIGSKYSHFAEKASPELSKLLDDKSSYVQYVALEALKKISTDNQKLWKCQEPLYESGN